jgi:Flp pilus assembly protein CpaB
MTADYGRVMLMRRIAIILGVILLVLGVIGLVHPSFNYHQQEEVAKIGPIKATVNEEKTAQIPPAVSVTLLVVGIALVLLGPRIKP